MSGVVVITPPPPPPPPPPNQRLPGQSLEAWYWAEAWRQSQLAAAAQSPMVRFKAWRKSRTILFNAAATAALSALVAYTGDVKEAFGEYGAIAVVVLIAGNAAWRIVTKTGLSK